MNDAIGKIKITIIVPCKLFSPMSSDNPAIDTDTTKPKKDTIRYLANIPKARLLEKLQKVLRTKEKRVATIKAQALAKIVVNFAKLNRLSSTAK